MRALRGVILFLILVTMPALAQAQVIVEANIAPPPLPVYEQPPIPGPGYIWTPGYWAYGGEGYYWVPGVWVSPPRVGLLWTPGYWGWRNGVYAWNTGYWGPRVGFYGGVAYGHGYTGAGYAGGYWRNGAFMYNRTVNNFGSTHINNVYSKTVVVNTTTTKTSFNGGPQGIQAKPNAAELAAAKEPHVAPTSAQTEHVKAAGADKRNLASTNNGHPPGAATGQPGGLQGKGADTPKTATTTTTKPAGNASTDKLNTKQNAGDKPNVKQNITDKPNAKQNVADRPNADRSGSPKDRAKPMATASVPHTPNPNARPARPARATANPQGRGHHQR